MLSQKVDTSVLNSSSRPANPESCTSPPKVRKINGLKESKKQLVTLTSLITTTLRKSSAKALSA